MRVWGAGKGSWAGDILGWGEQVVGGTGVRVGTLHLCQIQTLFLDILLWSWATQMCASETGGAHLSRDIGAAAVLPEVRGKKNLFSLACSSLPVPVQVRIVLPMCHLTSCYTVISFVARTGKIC